LMVPAPMPAAKTASASRGLMPVRVSSLWGPP
jgi:hypothetical protein